MQEGEPTANPARVTNQSKGKTMKEGKTIFRVWLRLERGGVMGVPFPANSLKRAEELREEAAKTFRGRALWLEYLGVMDADTNKITPQAEPPRCCRFCEYQREGCEGTADGEPCARFKYHDE